ncbi:MULTISPECIES: 50S ribosomal protein L33 [unclassified Streptomyces]|uniref:50S ribosomal protein L33 n=1 Tax=unclassified Streptomyces TaxID=2593676 RepID=UPI0029A3CC55|nr:MULTISPECIES: 50S ribosomal protein L33 [unclassified Streptomyces]MDX3767701.1 50S ribosomal protein L33 [Streptomyces sp. AK08-01B]MDX3820583.1 50S ribosomal protein L33 [Streptomyces sp. AK08-01A]
MARSGVRPVVTPRSSLGGTGIACVTWKNRQSDRVQLVLRKYGPVAGELVPFREER